MLYGIIISVLTHDKLCIIITQGTQARLNRAKADNTPYCKRPLLYNTTSPEKGESMAIITHPYLFSWNQVEAASDTFRLKWVLDTLPDESLMKMLENKRSRGRNDYPIRPTWNSLVAGIVYQHPTIASLRRELERNGELREVCGFDPHKGAEAVPSPAAYSRFLTKLCQEEPHKEFEKIHIQLVDMIQGYLPDLGKELAIDSKAVSSAGRPSKKKAGDGRRDTDADWGVKTYSGVREDGTQWEKNTKWFGYKMHMVADTKYEMPLCYIVTKASRNDSTCLPELMEMLKKNHPAIAEKAEYCTADRGYDSESNNRILYDDFGIIPVIDNRKCWKQEKTKSLYSDRVDNIVYDESGTIFCASQQSGCDIRLTKMAYSGLEKGRNTLKYRCPAAMYGYKCTEQSNCSRSSYGRVVRIPLDNERRQFVPLPRDTAKWKRLYKRRTAIERVFSRLDVSYGFEHHYVRGMKKMMLKTTMASVVMLSMALGSLRCGQHYRMRSLVKKFISQRVAA